MSKDIQKIIPVRPAYQVNRGAVKCESGGGVKYVATAIFDTAGNDSSGAANTAIGAHGLGVYIPIGAVITDAWIDVKTSFTSAGGNAATLAAKVEGAGDLVAAIAISNGTNVWNAGVRGTLVGATALDGNALTAIANAAAVAAALIKTTAEREITITTAGQILSAGKLAVFVEYFVSL